VAVCLSSRFAAL